MINTISIIMPCYNEENAIKNGVFDKKYAYLEKQDFKWEIIIVDDGSTDASKKLLEDNIKTKKNILLISIVHKGKLPALWAGLKKASGDTVLLSDFDDDYNLNELDNFLYWKKKGFDIVIGSRSNKRDSIFIIRKIGSFVFDKFRRFFILHHIKDTQCGFKLLDREISLKVFPKLYGLNPKKKIKDWKVSAFDVEMLFLFEQLGYKIKEVPIKLTAKNSQQFNIGKTKGYFFSAIEMFIEIIRIKIKQLRGKY